MEPFNFNELPEVVRRLFEKVEYLESLLLRLQPTDEYANDLMNVNEAAAFLKVSVASLYTKVSRKEIPFNKPGKRLYFTRSELQEWVLSAKVQKSQDVPSLYSMHKKIEKETKPHKLDKY